MDWHAMDGPRSLVSYDPTIGRFNSDAMIVVAELFIWPDVMLLLQAAAW
jgi:hypothetical protein